MVQLWQVWFFFWFGSIGFSYGWYDELNSIVLVFGGVSIMVLAYDNVYSMFKTIRLGCILEMLSKVDHPFFSS